MGQGSSEVVHSLKRPDFSISSRLLRLSVRARLRGITFAEVLDDLRQGGHLLLILFFSLPFAFPIPLPGLSIPFGIFIVLTTCLLILNRPPWVPKALLRSHGTPERAAKILRGAARAMRFLERLIHPRLEVLFSRAFRHFALVCVMVDGLVLALPLPPGTNFLPGISSCLLTVGILRRDGLCLLAGLIAFGATTYMCFLLYRFGAEFLTYLV